MKNTIRSICSFLLILAVFMSVFSVGMSALPVVKCESYVLVDASTGQVLCQENMSAKVQPMFAARIIAALIAVENVNGNDKVIVSADAVADTSDTYIKLFEAGENVRYTDLIYATLIYNAEDAANAISENVFDSKETFIRTMNTYAAKAGAKDTNFTNASGNYDESAYTTAADVAKIVAYAIKNAEFNTIFSTKYYEIEPNDVHTTVRKVDNDNAMLLESKSEYYSTAVSGAVGYLKKHGSSGVTVAEKNDMTLIAVAFGADTRSHRYSSLKAALNYGFKYFVRKSIRVPFVTVPIVENGYVVEKATTITAEVSYLLYNTLDEKDVTATIVAEDYYSRYNIAPAVLLSLPNNVTEMNYNIGTRLLDYAVEKVAEPYLYNSSEQPTEIVTEETPTEIVTEPESDVSLWIKIPAIVILSVIGFCIVVIIISVVFNLLRRRRIRNSRMSRRIR